MNRTTLPYQVEYMGTPRHRADEPGEIILGGSTSAGYFGTQNETWKLDPVGEPDDDAADRALRSRTGARSEGPLSSLPGGSSEGYGAHCRPQEVVN